MEQKLMKKITVLVDNGHGRGNGNQSPDGRLKEWEWCRRAAARVVSSLKSQGVEAYLLTPEEWNVSLSERARRANAWCSKVGSQNVLLVSMHNNAAGSGKVWRDARGFLPFIDPNAGSNSKLIATLMYDEAVKRGLKGNRKQWPYVTKMLTITHATKCPAVLTENLFQDNKEDVAYLLTEEGLTAIVDLHVEAIMKYIRKQ